MVNNKIRSEISILALDSHSPVEVSISFVWIRRHNRRVEAHIGNKYCVVYHSSIRFVNCRSHNWHNMCILNWEHLHDTAYLIRIYFICNIFGRCSSSNSSCCCWRSGKNTGSGFGWWCSNSSGIRRSSRWSWGSTCCTGWCSCGWRFKRGYYKGFNMMCFSRLSVAEVEYISWCLAVVDAVHKPVCQNPCSMLCEECMIRICQINTVRHFHCARYKLILPQVAGLHHWHISIKLSYK